MKLINTLLLAQLCFTLPGLMTPSAHADVLADFTTTIGQVNASYQSNYGLADYKKKLFQWDSETETNALIAKAKAIPNLSLEQAQALVQEYFNSTRDYHAQATYSGRPYISVPLGIHTAENRAFISFTGATYKGAIKVGDEVLTYNGDPVMTAIEKLKTPLYPNIPEVDLRDATRRLTARYGSLFDAIPTDHNLVLTLRDSMGKNYSETIAWSGFPATNDDSEIELFQELDQKDAITRIPANLRGMMLDDPYNYLSRKSYFPKPAVTTWEAADTDLFYGWIAEVSVNKNTRPKKIGLIRIPTFSLGAAANYTKSVAAFKVIVEKMNQETDGLILDVQGNRGGLMDYAQALFSFFIDKPVKASKYQYRLFQALVDDAVSSVADLENLKTQEDIVAYFGASDYGGYPLDLDWVKETKDFYQGIIDDAKTGAKFGKPRHYNIENVKPYPGVNHYLKPMIVMTDAWSASGGDWFPSFFQDYGRATIVGTQTAGAGAFTGSGNKLTNNLKVVSIVTPIAIEYRLHGDFIENKGVTPDIRIAPTAKDLEGANYKDYQKRLYQIIDRIVR